MLGIQYIHTDYPEDNMAFHEKSAWASLISIIAVFVPYFIIVFQYPMSFMGLLVGAVIAQVIVLIAFHVANAVASASIRKRGDAPPQDEMEKLIDLRAANIAGIVLSAVVVCWYLAVAFGVQVLWLSVADSQQSLSSLLLATIPAFPVLTAIHILFAGFVFSNVVYYAAIIFGYRKLTYAESQNP